MNAGWWDPEIIKGILNTPAKRYKYFVTDDKDEFLARLEIVNNNALKNHKDNLKYLEQINKIREVREGADIFKVFPWLKKDKEEC